MLYTTESKNAIISSIVPLYYVMQQVELFLMKTDYTDNSFKHGTLYLVMKGLML